MDTLNKISIKERLYLLSNICGLCGNIIKTIDDANIDHILPRSYGGTSRADNIHLTHRCCNGYKGNFITEKCRQKALKLYPKKAEVINTIKVVTINYESIKRSYAPFARQMKQKQKAQRKAARRRVVTTIVPSTAPMDLYNEFARNGMKNLSYDIILDYFNAYKNHDPHKVQIIEEK